MGHDNSKREQREYRFERWMHVLHARISGQGAVARLLYDEKMLGDHLVHSAVIDDALIELHVYRQGRGARLCLVSESGAAAQRWATAMAQAHRDIPRRYNAKRRFIHRVESLGEHLSASFSQRMAGFPSAEFAALQEFLAAARPMMGAEVSFRLPKKDQPATLLTVPPDNDSARNRGGGSGGPRLSARQMRRFGHAFAARIPVEHGTRAAIYRDGDFYLGATALIAFMRQRVAEEGEVADAVEEGVYAVENMAVDAIDMVDVASAAASAAIDTAHLATRAAGDVMEFASDTAGGAVRAAGDVGGCDLPDCDIISLPDCGGCDVPSCG